MQAFMDLLIEHEETIRLSVFVGLLVILSGIVGAVFGTFVLNLMRIKDPKARGLAIGIASHGIGTAHKLSINETSGAFAGLGMGLNALATALLLPLLYSLYHYFT